MIYRKIAFLFIAPTEPKVVVIPICILHNLAIASTFANFNLNTTLKCINLSLNVYQEELSLFDKNVAPVESKWL